MKIMVIGSGGREHALVERLWQSKRVEKIYALPGNGGMAKHATCVSIAAKDLDAIVSFATEHQIDFAVVAPDDPLVMGLVDRLHAIGIPCFGPEAKAALIEGSKRFAKDLMKKYHIPTADYEVFDQAEAAYAYLEQAPYPIVLKADGLALGKGVIIAEDKEAAFAAVKQIMTDKVFGSSGDVLVVEEFLSGPEVSVLAFTDGKTLIPLVSSMDHKRALDNDKGLNTGGMGAVAPNPYYTKEIADICMEQIFLPSMHALVAEGRTFRGCLYFGLMLTEKGPKVIEYNCRFGDPETQVTLPLLEGDLLEIMLATEEGRLAELDVVTKDAACCCVVLASAGYPEAYQSGFPISDQTDPADPNIVVYHAGSKLEDGVIKSAGGRVLGVTAVANTLPEAIEKAYDAVGQVQFENAYCRRDIGQRALAAQNILRKDG